MKSCEIYENETAGPDLQNAPVEDVSVEVGIDNDKGLLGHHVISLVCLTEIVQGYCADVNLRDGDPVCLTWGLNKSNAPCGVQIGPVKCLSLQENGVGTKN